MAVILFLLLGGTIPPPSVQSILFTKSAMSDTTEIVAVQSAIDDIFMASSGGARRVRWAEPVALRFVSGSSIIQQAAALPGRKYLLFLDWDTIDCGKSTFIQDDTPGPENRNNSAPGYAWIGRQCWTGRDAAHELVHLLGGVQHSAPHASGGQHCIDAYDVMCYSDPPDYPSLTYPCGLAHMALLDCGSDDYFNASPSPGSYLATHWNVADSVFLARMQRVFLPVVAKQ